MSTFDDNFPAKGNPKMSDRVFGFDSESLKNAGMTNQALYDLFKGELDPTLPKLADFTPAFDLSNARVMTSTAPDNKLIKSNVLDPNTGEYVTFKEVDSGTADGVIVIQDAGKYYRRVWVGNPSPKWFGAKFDGTTDDTVALQAFLDYFGYIVLEQGTTIVTDSLKIGSGGKYIGTRWIGQGMEKSTIRAVGMTGKNVIEPVGGSQYIRVSMADFRIDGDADTCIRLDTTLELYESKFENLKLSSVGNSAFMANKHFSCSWYNVHTYSTLGHGFDIRGGNSTIMINCYGHLAGADKGAYRIKGSATMIGCNGVDSAGHWGIFGPDSGEPNVMARLTMIGCNIEDFSTRGLTFLFETKLFMVNTSFVIKSSGTYESEMRFASSNHSVNLQGCTIASKGATRTGTAPIVATTTFPFVNFKTDNNTFTTASLGGTVVSMPNENLVLAEAGKIAYKLPNVTFDRNYGFNSQIPVTWTPNSNTYSGLNRENIKTANTQATIFRTLSNAVEGQHTYINVRDNFTTFINMFGGAGRFKLKGGADLSAVSGTVYHFYYDGTQHIEV